MKLPNRKQAYIPSEKLTDYLLSESHSVGKSKAAFFRNHGYTEANAALLEKHLLQVVQENELSEAVPSNFGTKYIIEGPVTTPTGSTVRLRTVWIIESGDEYPRLVTAYPI